MCTAAAGTPYLGHMGMAKMIMAKIIFYYKKLMLNKIDPFKTAI